MRNRLHAYICIFVLLEIIQPPTFCYAKVINDARSSRMKRNISQPKENADYARDLQEVSSKHEEKDDDNLEEGNVYLKDKRKISKRSVNPVNADFQQSNAEKPVNYDNSIAISDLSSQRSNDESDYTEEADDEAARQERKDEESSDLARSPRAVNPDPDKYTQDERSSLYDDYEAKDVAKRGVLGGPEDYEEAEDDDSPGMEDAAAAREQESAMSETEKREMQNDARMKRDRAVAEALDKPESSPDNQAQPKEESRIASADPYLRQVSPVEPSKSFNETSARDDAPKIKGSGSNEATSGPGGSSKVTGPTGVIASSKEDKLNAKYVKRVEEEVQRRIASIKEEIRRDVEAQRRIRGIVENNARFDELRNRERESEEGEPIEKRQIVDKGATREAASPRRSGSKRSLKGERSKKLQRRSSEIGKDVAKENTNLKRQSVSDGDESSGRGSSQGLFKKKRERVRQTFLMNNKKRRRSASCTSDRTGARPENELPMAQDSNSNLRTDNRMLQAPSSIAGEDENNEGEQSPTAARSNALVSLTGSAQELNPRLAKEYKEAFGGLQSESGNALARFKRVKRVLDASDAAEKI